MSLASACDDLGVADQEGHAPAGHRERLRHRVQLDRALLGPLGLQDRRRLVAVEAELGVGVVVDEHDLVLAGEVDHPLHEVEVDARGGRVVRERAARSPGAWATSTRTPRCRFSKKSSPVPIGISRTSAPANSGPQMWIGYDGDGTRAASPGWSSTHIRWEKPSLAPMVVIDLGVGVERRRRSGAGRGRRRPGAASGCPGWPSSGGCGGCGPPRTACRRRVGRRQVGVAEAEVDHVLAGPPGLHLQPVDDGEDVRRQGVDPAELHGQPPSGRT